MTREKNARPADNLISNWQSGDEDTPFSDKRGIWAVVIGGGLFGLPAGAVVGHAQMAGVDPAGSIILASIGAFAGAVGCALLGFLVALIGELIAGKSGLDRVLRAISGGRLDSLRGRILYGASLGAIGGPFITIPLRAAQYSPAGYLFVFVVGVVFWASCGAAGGAIDWLGAMMKRGSAVH